MPMTQKNPHAKRLRDSVELAQGIDKLLAIMRALRDPTGGCPWDQQQSYETILPFTLEEVYEVVESVESGDFDALRDELGDLLFQIIFYAQMAQEEGRFEFADITTAICDKLVRRHPHVFGDQIFRDEAELKQAWESQKHLERQDKSAQMTSLLDDIPRALPELKKAQKIQKRVARVGFDWENVAQVWEKLAEEELEIQEAAQKGDKAHLQEEIGDLLFAMVNLSRHYGVDADQALRQANLKFEKRFREVETIAGQDLGEFDLAQLEVFWQQAKKNTQ